MGWLTHGIAEQDGQEASHEGQEAGQRRVDRRDEGVKGLHMKDTSQGLVMEGPVSTLTDVCDALARAWHWWSEHLDHPLVVGVDG